MDQAILQNRKKTHGSWGCYAKAAQNLRAAFHDNCVVKLDDEKTEALEMVISKMARIMTGDPGFKDHWDDIAGYAQRGAETCLLLPLPPGSIHRVAKTSDVGGFNLP